MVEVYWVRATDRRSGWWTCRICKAVAVFGKAVDDEFGKGFDESSLRRMRQLYDLFDSCGTVVRIELVQLLVALVFTNSYLVSILFVTSFWHKRIGHW